MGCYYSVLGLALYYGHFVTVYAWMFVCALMYRDMVGELLYIGLQSIVSL